MYFGTYSRVKGQSWNFKAHIRQAVDLQQPERTGTGTTPFFEYINTT